MLAEKDEDGDHVLSKADGSAYDIYRDGLRVITTIDSRMQGMPSARCTGTWRENCRRASNAICATVRKRRHRSLRTSSPRSGRPSSTWPCADSDRYKKGIGKLCPSCPSGVLHHVHDAGRRP